MARRNGDLQRVALAVGFPSGFEDDIVRGAIGYAEQVGRWTFDNNGHRPFKPFHQIDLAAVDGVIGLLDPEHAEAIHRAGVAAVNCSTRLADLPLSRVGNDDEAIGRMGATHLLGLGFAGYRFIVAGDTWYGQRRLAGFREVMEGQAARQIQILDLSHQDEPSASRTISQWLGEVPRPIAVMATNDTIGRLTINAAIELGLHIPEHLAGLGVDNDRWASATSAVALSSIEIDAKQIGYRAAQMLDELMAGQAPTPVQWVPPIGVVTRHSTDIVMQEDPLVTQALRIMRDRCEEALTVERVLDALGVSRRTLENRLKAAIGQTPQTAIYHARIERAKKLLVGSSQSMGQIARRCGFKRPERFSLVFKRLIGLTPGQFRQQRGIASADERRSYD